MSTSNESIQLADVKGYPRKIATVQATDSSTDSVKSGQVESVESTKQSVFNIFMNTFRRAQASDDDDEITDEEAQKYKGTNKIHPVAANLIALSGGVGTGLLVGTGQALTYGGPAGLIIAVVLISIGVVCTMMGAGELAVSYQTLSGGFNAYPSLLVDPSLGFAVAWGYAINWLLVLPLEMVTASMTIKYWNDQINPAVFVTVFLLLVAFCNVLFGARGYSALEMGSSCMKILMIGSFLISMPFAITGTLPKTQFIGAKFYKDPGAFANGIKGICACFVTSAFSLGGTEFMVLTAADQKNPRKAIPSSIKYVIYRVVVFYIATITMIGLLIPYNSSQLMGSETESSTAPVSPFVIAVVNAHLNWLAHFYNATILCAVVSVGNAAFYSSSNTVCSLAEQGYNAKWLAFKDRSGRPLRAMLVTGIVGLLGYIACYKEQEKVFTWLLSMSGLSTLFTWISINISHICFVRASAAQNISRDTLGYRSPLGVYGSYIGLAINFFVVIVHFWVSLFPLNNGGRADAVHFFQNCMGLFTFLAFYLGYKASTTFKGDQFIWFYKNPLDVDLQSHRSTIEVEELEREDAEQKEIFKTLPWYQKAIEKLF